MACGPEIFFGTLVNTVNVLRVVNESKGVNRIADWHASRMVAEMKGTERWRQGCSDRVVNQALAVEFTWQPQI